MRELMLIFHFLGLAMGIGASFAWLFLGISGAKSEADQARQLRSNTTILSTMAHIGITLLILSGGYLMTPYWKTLGQMPLLIIKLSLVVVFAALLGITSGKIKKLKKSDSNTGLRRVELFSILSLVTGVSIIILAVFVFR